MSNNSAIKDYIDAQSDLALAIKNATGFVNNDYADLNEVVRVVKEAFQPRNFVINHVQFATEQGDFLKTVFEHSSGKTWETSVRLLYKPNDMQSLGSAITYARRYGLSQLGGVISGNKDDDGEQALNPVAREVKRYESITPKKGITLAQQNLLERAVKTENWLIDGATPENFEEGFNRGTVLVKQLNEFSKRIGDAVAEAFSNHKLAKREQENATN
tara:strand:+ start:22539 stop:23186 length:648 start_codon:yes stop_codon:yes gene_type:complete